MTGIRGEFSIHDLDGEAAWLQLRWLPGLSRNFIIIEDKVIELLEPEGETHLIFGTEDEWRDHGQKQNILDGMLAGG